jgi:hypothetical protein
MHFQSQVFTYSSSVTRLRVFAQLCITSFPVAVDPVKLTLLIPPCAVSHGPRLSSPLRHWSTPGGKKRCASSTSFRSQYGVNGLSYPLAIVNYSLDVLVGTYDGFTMRVFPVTKAGAILPHATRILAQHNNSHVFKNFLPSITGTTKISS